METIIGLLFVLLPVIFKLIGKKLERSGQPEKAGKFKNIAHALGDDDETPIYDRFDGPEKPDEVKRPSIVPVVEDDLAAPAAAKPEPVVAEVVRRTTSKPINVSARQEKRKKPILQEEAVVKKEKIDPKKLVIYSEIMKPKYTE